MLIEKHKEKLNHEMEQSQKITFEKYVDCAEEYICLISMRAFCDGFCLAGKLMTEALSEDS